MIEDALNKSVILADQQIFVSLVDNTDYDMSLIIRIVIVGINDSYRIEQSHLVLEP